jgi:phosphohistidine phosphatase
MSNRDVTSLHLLRHAHAGDPGRWNGPDSERPLSEKGRHQAESLGFFLAEAGFQPDVIATSPYLRALDTARLVATPLEMPVVVRDELAGSLDARRIEQLLAALGNPSRPLLVGHDPDFSELAAELTGAAELPMRKGTLIRIDLVRPVRPAQGIVRWLVPPELLSPGEREGD